MIKCCEVYYKQDGKCRNMPLCNHKENMKKAPEWLYDLLVHWINKIHNLDVSNPLRQKFHYPGSFMGYSPILVYSDPDWKEKLKECPNRDPIIGPCGHPRCPYCGPRL